MNKTLTIIEPVLFEDIYKVVRGWNIAQWGGKDTLAVEASDFGGGDIIVDSKIPHNRLTIMLAECGISQKDVLVHYFIEDLKGEGLSVANTLTLLEDLGLLNIADCVTDKKGTYIEVEVYFNNCELVEKVFKKFQIIS
jgi:hypothetical protein